MRCPRGWKNYYVEHQYEVFHSHLVQLYDEVNLQKHLVNILQSITVTNRHVHFTFQLQRIMFLLKWILIIVCFTPEPYVKIKTTYLALSAKFYDLYARFPADPTPWNFNKARPGVAAAMVDLLYKLSSSGFEDRMLHGSHQLTYEDLMGNELRFWKRIGHCEKKEKSFVVRKWHAIGRWSFGKRLVVCVF